jgi:hypothetical protein
MLSVLVTFYKKKSRVEAFRKDPDISQCNKQMWENVDLRKWSETNLKKLFDDIGGNRVFVLQLLDDGVGVQDSAVRQIRQTLPAAEQAAVPGGVAVLVVGTRLLGYLNKKISWKVKKKVKIGFIFKVIMYVVNFFVRSEQLVSLNIRAPLKSRTITNM